VFCREVDRNRDHSETEAEERREPKRVEEEHKREKRDR
jgi:hypothetical protein